jgi:hypothetical protein
MLYDEKELIEIVKKCESKTEILQVYGLKNNGGNYNILDVYLKKFKIDTSNLDGRKRTMGGFKPKRELKDILVENSDYMSSNHLKNRLYKEGLKERICELCGQDENWKGKKISLILDHENGINDDNRLINLRIVCPNCNATLPTHCRGDVYRKKENINKIKKEKNINKLKENSDDKIKRLKEKRKVERPSYEQLMIDIKENGYSKTGKKYNVSDNSIRKWIKFFKKYEIN